ncbi:MAG: hypothetical protein JO179_18005 [Solirubrobacterales bacterium]|nr:hypothetical protein [Solirubrobacterales bacterium]
MPHLPRSITDAAIFLYPSEEEASKRAGWGGSGFLVGIPSEADPAKAHLCAVSNDHVTLQAPVIRVEKMDGSVEIIAGDPSDWVVHPDGDDIAVRPLGTAPVVIEQIRDQRIFVDAYCFFAANRLIRPEDFNWGVGPSVGDECLMVGRYINHDDEQFNRGVVRFGNLAMFPEPIRQHERAFDQESFLVDMRSVSGFSGSAVLVYYTEPGTLSMTMGEPRPWRTLLSEYWVLGVNWGHLPGRLQLREDGQDTRVLLDSSMAGVLPAWKVSELLQEEQDVVKRRQQVEARLAHQPIGGAELDVEEPSDAPRDEGSIRRIVPKADFNDGR